DRAGDAPTAPRRLPARPTRTGRSVRAAPPPLGIAFRVPLVAPPRPVRGPGRAEWVPSAGTSNGPLPSRGPAPTISAPARDGPGAVPSPSPRRSPLPEADSDPTGHQLRPDRRPAAQGVLPWSFR